MKKSIHLFSAKGMVYIIALTLLFVFSCNKFVNVGPPASEVESAQVFNNGPATISAALGVYANMGLSNLTICSGGSTLYPALSADEVTYNYSNSEIFSFQDDQVIPNNGQGLYSRLWVPAYSNIYNANAILEGVKSSATLNDTIRKQVEGEMLVVRALNYFYLVNLFGDVPLELTTNYQVNAVMPRTATAIIYAQLAADLEKADLLLVPGYPNSANTRPNKWTADALLARVSLYRQDWTSAKNYASAVINSEQYQLESDLNNVFQQGSAETIWQLGNDYHNTAEGSTFIPYSSAYAPSYSITPFLLASFDTNDLRLADWIGQTTVSGTTYYYPYKYENRAYSPVTEYEVILRLAELYLIRAEANARLGDYPDAVNDLNIIRQRAGLAPISATTESSLLTAIMAERQKELFCEWGNRWLDLKRTNAADSVLGKEKPMFWKPYAKLYPLPEGELQSNPTLVQNPGY